MTTTAHNTNFHYRPPSSVRDEKVKEVVGDTMIIIPIITAIASATALYQVKREKQEQLDIMIQKEEALLAPVWLKAIYTGLKQKFLHKAEVTEALEVQMSSWTWSSTADYIDDNEAVQVFLKSGCNFWTFVLFGMALAYLTYACISNLVACCKFIRAWNNSSSLRHRQLSRSRSNIHQFYNPYRVVTPTKPVVQKPRPNYQDVLHVQEFVCCFETGTETPPPLMQRLPTNVLECKDGQCPICMCDFEEKELVTSCRDGCANWFHKDCLFEWLDRSHDSSCPCCRKDMLAAPMIQKSMLKEFSSFLGYYSH